MLGSPAELRERVLAWGILQNNDRNENCNDNAAIESFFATLKLEFARARNEYVTRDIAQSSSIDYFHFGS